MLCPSCHSFRPEDNGPCPRCFAPSPLAGTQNGGAFSASFADNWGGPITPSGGDEWESRLSPAAAQAGAWGGQTFGVKTGWPQTGEAPPQPYDNSLWTQIMTPQTTQEQNSGRLAPPQSDMLPVPYGAGQLPVLYPGTMANGFPAPTIQTGGMNGALVPGHIAGDGPILVPPMYTRPRAVIPRYRVISGFLSFIIVIGLLAAGGIFYAKATGKLTFLSQLFNPHYQNISPTPVSLLPTPAVSVERGPAYNIINSATTASSIDQTYSYPKIATNTFLVGQPIYVTYSVHSNTAGTVTFKWYTNGLDYYDSTPIQIPVEKNGVNGNTAQTFVKPLEGMVEIYWNNQLAIRLYFVVEPQSNQTG